MVPSEQGNLAVVEDVEGFGSGGELDEEEDWETEGSGGDEGEDGSQ